VSFIAAGGMGEVYEARDTRLNRRVAIKVLPAAYGTDRDRLARFEKEARSASQLAHPNIISVYDVGEEADLPYIVTELLEGRTLATALHERRLSINEAMDIAVQVARGLAAAHEKRIVHRDLKPANIYITTAGHVKILDFGLAKLTEEEWQPGTSEETKSLISRPGVIVGSAAYMSPEQVQGAAADLRSDIFSFGSILYEMVTGRRPFRGNSPIETMSAILRDEPPPIGPTDCAPEVTALVNRCLAKRPDGRFPTGAELLFALQQTALMGPAGMVRPLRPSQARRSFARGNAVAAGERRLEIARRRCCR
jgi:serine/threonine protein kinase